MTRTDPSVAAIVLAAGQGTRFAAASGGSHKLLAKYGAVPMVRHVVTTTSGSRARPVIVVTGHQRDAVKNALSGLSFIEARNARYAGGMASSLQAGILAVPKDADAVVILLADMPRVSETLIDRLVGTFIDNSAADAVIPVHAGKRGNPVLLSRKLFGPIMQLAGDEGARKLLTACPQVIEIDIDDDAIAFDVDTPDVLDR